MFSYWCRTYTKLYCFTNNFFDNHHFYLVSIIVISHSRIWWIQLPHTGSNVIQQLMSQYPMLRVQDPLCIPLYSWTRIRFRRIGLRGYKDTPSSQELRILGYTALDVSTYRLWIYLYRYTFNFQILHDPEWSSSKNSTHCCGIVRLFFFWLTKFSLWANF
jgi:hypothetical protein